MPGRTAPSLWCYLIVKLVLSWPAGHDPYIIVYHYYSLTICKKGVPIAPVKKNAFVR